jgi:hypothetical protein
MIIQHYCTYARGVDIINQLHYNYIIGRKSRRCWPRLVWWLLELCIINAFYLWKKQKQGKSHKKFRLLLIKEILATYNPNIVLSSSEAIVNIPNTFEHHIVLSPSQRRCNVCYSKGIRKDTKFMCSSCNQYVCVTPCFDIHRSNI